MNKFIFKEYEEDLASGKIKFTYVLVHNSKELTFHETLSFAPVETFPPKTLLKNVLDSLHLALGISYWKLYCPKEIETPNINLSKEEANFWNTVYTKGLGEFYYKNNIDYRNIISFPYVDVGNKNAVSFPRQNRSLVGIGGGKDSIVTAKILQKSKLKFSGFILNPKPLQENVSEKLEIETIEMKREIDIKLLELNQNPDTYNGHIPISMVYAFVSLFAAIINDYKYIIVSNEKSSNYGNVEYLNQEINHQWSKSEEFEKLFQNYTKDFITPDVTYFSALRGLYEIKITEMFTKYPEFFPIFSSCNTNFKQNASPKNTLWCGGCAKCAFVFTLLAAFLTKEAVVDIFGENLFEKETLTPIFQELLGLKDIKPFDCVGTPEEMKLALIKAQANHGKTVIIEMFNKNITLSEGEISTFEEKLLSVYPNSLLPEEFKIIFETYDN